TALPSSPFGVGTPDLEAIAITPDQPPVAVFNAQRAPAGEVTRFDASGSTDSDGTVARYRWDFGDATAAVTTDKPVKHHVYAHPGTYLVELTVTDNEGCSAQRIFT